MVILCLIKRLIVCNFKPDATSKGSEFKSGKIQTMKYFSNNCRLWANTVFAWFYSCWIFLICFTPLAMASVTEVYCKLFIKRLNVRDMLTSLVAWNAWDVKINEYFDLLGGEEYKNRVKVRKIYMIKILSRFSNK